MATCYVGKYQDTYTKLGAEMWSQITKFGFDAVPFLMVKIKYIIEHKVLV
ncbi:hypothetical protein [Staphylococcus shinii]